MSHSFMSVQAAQDINHGHNYCPFIPVFGPPAVMFERGKGTELWDVAGKRYLDFLSGIAVVSLGHANDAVAAAISARPTPRGSGHTGRWHRA